MFQTLGYIVTFFSLYALLAFVGFQVKEITNNNPFAMFALLVPLMGIIWVSTWVASKLKEKFKEN